MFDGVSSVRMNGTGGGHTAALLQTLHCSPPVSFSENASHAGLARSGLNKNGEGTGHRPIPSPSR